MTFLLRYWKPIAGALLALFLVGAILSYGHRQYERGVADAQSDARIELEKDRELRRQTDWKVRQDYEARIADLNATVARERRGKSIRCVLGDPGEVRAGRDSGGPTDGAAGESAVRAAADLRPELVHRGETCERLRQQLIAIKARQEALHGER
jgi:hypothetical protein